MKSILTLFFTLNIILSFGQDSTSYHVHFIKDSDHKCLTLLVGYNYSKNNIPEIGFAFSGRYKFPSVMVGKHTLYSDSEDWNYIISNEFLYNNNNLYCYPKIAILGHLNFRKTYFGIDYGLSAIFHIASSRLLLGLPLQFGFGFKRLNLIYSITWANKDFWPDYQYEIYSPRHKISLICFIPMIKF